MPSAGFCLIGLYIAVAKKENHFPVKLLGPTLHQSGLDTMAVLKYECQDLCPGPMPRTELGSVPIRTTRTEHTGETRNEGWVWCKQVKDARRRRPL